MAVRCIRRTLSGVAVLAGIWMPAQAQQVPVFESETTLKEFEVRVTDTRGRPITGLSREDFELLENGHPQRITTFEYVTRRVPEYRSVEPLAPASPGVADPHAAANELRRSTFIYIAARGRRQDRLRIHSAIREFIDEQLAPDVFVSLEGAPFTQSKSELNKRLAEMLPGWMGSTGLSPVDTVPVDQSREIGGSSSFDDLLGEVNDDFGQRMEAISDRGAFYRRLRIYEYLDLIQALSIYPGSKMVVLFTSRLPTYEDNYDMMKVFENAATKARVRFYVQDVVGLSATPPGGDAETRGSFASMIGNPFNNGFQARSLARQDRQDGLRDFARVTGGRAVLNSNDVGEVFDVISRENGDYYLLGYYPEQLEQLGRFRRLRVKVRQGGLRVSHRRGYYEERPFRQMTKYERNLRMHQALSFETPYLDLPLKVDHEFFRDSSGSATLVYSVGLHTGDIPSVATKKGEKVQLTIIAQASLVKPEEAALGEAKVRTARRLFIDDRQFQMTVDSAAHERLSTDPRSWVHYGSQMRLPPGTYDWRVVVREDLSGTLGTYQNRIRIPRSSQDLGASTLLLTGRIDDVGEPFKSKKNALEDVLLVAGSRFYAIASKTFRQGEPLFLLYDIYNPGESSLNAAPRQRIALYRERKPVPQLPVTGYQSVVQPEANRVRQMAALNTEELEAGDYTIVAMLPSDSDTRPIIFREFTLLPAQAE